MKNEKTITVHFIPGIKGAGGAVCGFGDPKIEVTNIQNESLSISDFYAIQDSLRKGHYWPRSEMECVYVRNGDGYLELAEKKILTP